MPFSYPHFGSLKYVFQSLFQDLGRKDIILPNPPSNKTFQLGARHSPEFVCTPFKMTLGTFLESIERGADELGMGGGHGYCRFRFYWQVQKLILEDLGYDNIKWVTLDYESALDILLQLKRVSVGLNTLQTIRVLQKTWVRNRLTDITDRQLYKYRAIEIEKGTAERLADEVYQMIVNAKNMRQIKKLGRNIPKIFEEKVEVDKKANPLKVVVNGEIYVVLEPALNLDIHRRLNELGVITKTPVTLRRFIDFGERLNPFKKMDWQKANACGVKYVPYRLGGETQENLGDAVLYKKQGWDGLVHLYPFTCMPEIVTRSIFPQVSREHDMPVLSLVVDEHTGEAGFQTRLEAFIDLLSRRKNGN
ncbi:MAG: CoA protein activase [Asgard group archaeon]|nr:CoA protein activase [Asgard group archaeon]